MADQKTSDELSDDVLDAIQGGATSVIDNPVGSSKPASSNFTDFYVSPVKGGAVTTVPLKTDDSDSSALPHATDQAFWVAVGSPEKS